MSTASDSDEFLLLSPPKATADWKDFLNPTPPTKPPTLLPNINICRPRSPTRSLEKKRAVQEMELKRGLQELKSKLTGLFKQQWELIEQQEDLKMRQANIEKMLRESEEMLDEYELYGADGIDTSS